MTELQNSNENNSNIIKNWLNKWRGDCKLIEFLQLRDMVMVFEWDQFYTFKKAV